VILYGNLTAEDGREFGYELTFFKRITNEDKLPVFIIPIPAYWYKDVGMIGHFTITDLANKKFKTKEINNYFNRSTADEKKYDVLFFCW